MPKNKLSNILSETRKRRGISQKQAALELGISQALLSHYEKGIRECSLDFLVKAADYYSVTTDYLLGHSTTKNARSAHAQRQRSLVRTLETIMLLSERLDDDDLRKYTGEFIKKSLYRVLKLYDGILEGLDFRGDDIDIANAAAFAERDFSKAYSAAREQKDSDISLHSSSLEYLSRLVNEVETQLEGEAVYDGI